MQLLVHPLGKRLWECDHRGEAQTQSVHAFITLGLQEVEESKATSMSAEELMDLLKADAGSNDVPQSGVVDDKARFFASLAIFL